MSTSQQSLITVTVDGVSLGVFDSLSGGNTAAEPAKHRPGGMGQERTYAGLSTQENVTVSRVYERERDHELLRSLASRAGRARMTISERPLDDDGLPWGRAVVRTGRLGPISRGDVDSTSGDPRMFELTCIVESIA